MDTRPNDIEMAVIQRMLADPGLSPREGARGLLAHLVVVDRHLSEVGFIASFRRDDAARLFSGETSLRWGKVLGRLNGVVDADFIIYVDDGYVHAVEGATFGEDEWPETAGAFELFDAKVTE